MRDDLRDPTAGPTARVFPEHREIPQPITDPTDPRYGLAEEPEEQLIQDPTGPGMSGRWRRGRRWSPVLLV